MENEGRKHILEIIKSPTVHILAFPLFLQLHRINFVQNPKYVPRLECTEIMGSTETPSLPTRGAPVGISALVVGGGVAGLMCALELWRHGIDVQIIERSPSRNTSGVYIYCRRYLSQLTGVQGMDLLFHTI